MTAGRVIAIDKDRCDGCGACVSACAEGAIAVVDGKARLVGDGACDGFGACLGECPRGAITLAPGGSSAPDRVAALPPLPAGPAQPSPHGPRPSALTQWPVQLHLISPGSAALVGADLLLAADCVAYALADFHQRHLAGRALAIACPKLDADQAAYVETLTALLAEARIASLTVIVMEVPCCSGLVRLANAALARSGRELAVRVIVVGVRGGTVREATLPAPLPGAPRRSA